MLDSDVLHGPGLVDDMATKSWNAGFKAGRSDGYDEALRTRKMMTECEDEIQYLKTKVKRLKRKIKQLKSRD